MRPIERVLLAWPAYLAAIGIRSIQAIPTAKLKTLNRVFFNARKQAGRTP